MDAESSDSAADIVDASRLGFGVGESFRPGIMSGGSFGGGGKARNVLLGMIGAIS
jgi:hypothetical protein